MQTLKELSREIAMWAVNNELTDDYHSQSERPFMGMVEELGELSHARLKREQGIRGMVNTTTFMKAEQDALADLMIYWLHYCFMRRIDPDRLIMETWKKVKERDWNKNKETGNADQSTGQ